MVCPVCAPRRGCAKACASRTSTAKSGDSAVVQFLFSVPHVLYGKKGSLSFPHLSAAIQDWLSSLTQASFDLLPVMFSLCFSFRSSVFFCLPLHCWNPFLARPKIPFLCALHVSEDEGTLFLYHHLSHFHQLPGCFPHGILVQPLSIFSC